MKLFWRDRPFNRAEQSLWDAVALAHDRSVERPNISTMTLLNCATGSCSLLMALAGAMMSLGGTHGPVEQSMVLLLANEPAKAAQDILAAGNKVPGWGNSFAHGRIDPLWKPVDDLIRTEFPWLCARLSAVTAVLHEAGKEIYPNPSAYTAALAIAVELPVGMSTYILVAGRLHGWAEAVWKSTYGARTP